MKKNQKKWSNKEIELLINNNNIKNTEIFKLFPDRSKASIENQRSRLGLKKERCYYDSDSIDILLEDNHISYYWIGFLLADGCIYNDKLALSISVEDINHINKISEYIGIKTIYAVNHNKGYSNNSAMSYILISNKRLIPQIMEKFDWKYRKTYNPPDITKYKCSQELLKSLFIGFIDGDGCIRKQTGRKDTMIQFRVHSSWIVVLNAFKSVLNFNVASPYIGKDGYCQWNIGNHYVQSLLREHINTYNLPVLERKWNKLSIKR